MLLDVTTEMYNYLDAQQKMLHDLHTTFGKIDGLVPIESEDDQGPKVDDPKVVKEIPFSEKAITPRLYALKKILVENNEAIMNLEKRMGEAISGAQSPSRPQGDMMRS